MAQNLAPTPTYVTYGDHDSGWLVYLRYGRLLVLVGCYATRAEALAVASQIDGLPA